MCQVHKFSFKEECDKCGSKKTDEAVAEVDALIKKNEDGAFREFPPRRLDVPCVRAISTPDMKRTKCDNTTMK